MATQTISKKRAELLARLEDIIGSECYNDNIQNWGPGGVYEGEGRDFRYPVTFIDTHGKKIKKRSAAIDLPAEIIRTGHYAFGANRLHIVMGLDRVISFLEREYDLKI